MRLVGSVHDKIAWIIGDMIEDLTGYLNAVALVKTSGAKFIALACVHALLTHETYVELQAHPDIDLVSILFLFLLFFTFFHSYYSLIQCHFPLLKESATI